MTAEEEGSANTSSAASVLASLDDVGIGDSSSWFNPDKFSGRGQGGGNDDDDDNDSESTRQVHQYIDELRLYVPTSHIQNELKELLSKLKQEVRRNTEDSLLLFPFLSREKIKKKKKKKKKKMCFC